MAIIHVDQDEIKRLRAQFFNKIVRIVGVAFLVTLLGVLCYMIYFGFTYGWPDWTGFNAQKRPADAGDGFVPEKTLWDWMQLLVVPFVLAIGAFFLSEAQRKNAEKIAEQRAKTEREVEDRRSQDDILETYIDKIGEMLVEKNILLSKPDDEIRDLLRIRTLTALRRFDNDHNKILTHFLKDAGILDAAKNGGGIIDLTDVDLAEAKLKGVYLPSIHLQRADLRNADLRYANLQGADLREASLQGARLESANLQGANLSGASLVDANLSGANLKNADLSNARLHTAKLAGANMEEANLQGAYLASANLAYAQLDRANLQDISTGRAESFFEYTWRGIRSGRKGRPTSFNGASLKGANLQGAKLYRDGVNLKNADLQGANMKDAVRTWFP
jgi:uncharacterized protein YjbI with pentapeptide repeats